MDEQRDEGTRRLNPQDLWKLILAIIGIIAVVRELRLPQEDRTWHGTVGFVPYNFRKPTGERFRETYWNPEGPLLSSRVWGAGWAVNFGAIKRLVAKDQ